MILYKKEISMEQEYDYGEEEIEYDYDNYIEEEQQDNHSNPQSHDERNYDLEPYQIFPLEKIYHQLLQILEEVKLLVYLDKGWCLLLLKEFKWDKEILREDYYNKLEYYQKKIGLKSGLLPLEQCHTVVSDCYVCCAEGVMTFQNICGHSFCVGCWIETLKNNIISGNPFMNCMESQCGVPFLMESVESILTIADQEELKKKWKKKLCQQLITANRYYQFCTGIDCGNCIKINQIDIDTVKCVCGKIFCFRCQSDDHYPCECEEKTKWVQQVMAEEADAKWISSNAKICPWCKKAVQRSMGCNFMACTCGKNFCYMCSHPWEPDHKDHFKCHIYKKKPDEILNREKEVMERMNHCTERYVFNQAVANNYKEIDVFTKRKYLFKVLGLELMESEFMETAYKFAIECCEKLKWIYAFTFFNDMKQRKDAFEFSMGQYEKYKENLLKLLAVDLKQFMTEVKTMDQENNLNSEIKKKLIEKFKSLKQTIVNLYTCTKSYKEKFVEELQQITENIHQDKEVEEMKNYKTAKSKSQDKKEQKGILSGLMSWGKSKTKSKKK